MSEHTELDEHVEHISETIDRASNRQLIDLAMQVRKLWRAKVAAGKLVIEPQKMRKYDATLAELRQLTGE